MFKKISLVLAALAVTSSVYASRIDEGTLEISGNASLDFITQVGARFYAGAGAGYFIRPGTLLGGRFAVDASRDYTNLGIYLVAEQHLELDSPFIPYLGVDVGVLTCSYKRYGDDWGYDDDWGWDDEFDSSSGNGSYMLSSDRGKNNAAAMVIALRPGFKLYFTDMVCLDSHLEIALASNKIFKYKRGEQNKGHSVGLRTGLRYAFF